MALDSISPPTRSRSPTRALSSSTGTSPFHRPPGWTPPTATPHRPVILQLDLKPMQQLADRNPYFNILAPKVAGNLSTAAYDSLFQTFKVIYPDYASCHICFGPEDLGDGHNRTTLVNPPTVNRLLHDDRHGSRHSDIGRFTSFHPGHPQLVLPYVEDSPTLGCLHIPSILTSLIDTSSGFE